MGFNPSLSTFLHPQYIITTLISVLSNCHQSQCHYNSAHPLIPIHNQSHTCHPGSTPQSQSIKPIRTTTASAAAATTTHLSNIIDNNQLILIDNNHSHIKHQPTNININHRPTISQNNQRITDLTTTPSLSTPLLTISNINRSVITPTIQISQSRQPGDNQLNQTPAHNQPKHTIS